MKISKYSDVIVKSLKLTTYLVSFLLHFLCQILQSKLNYTIKPEEISIAHRLGPKSNKKRPIIVKFTRRSIKHNIVRKCVNIKPNFGVSESLSPYRRKIYSTLRTIKGPRGSNSDIQQLHTNDGTIVVKLTSSNSYHKINDEKSLTKFLDSHPNIKDKYIELISHQLSCT